MISERDLYAAAATGKENNDVEMRKKQRWFVPLAILALLLCAIAIYNESIYRADADAKAALTSDETVRVLPTDFGWRFDGPSESDALIFYPGAKVEAEAYAPLCRALARDGVDVCLVRMPLRLAFLGQNKADSIIADMDYERWLIGGHSLGGACAALYAARHPETLDGVVLLAAFATRPLDDGLSVLSVYGTEDGVLHMDRYQKCLDNLPAQTTELVIEGGNHAQFGSYGSQKGDGAARITREDQIEETAAAIAAMIQEIH